MRTVRLIASAAAVILLGATVPLLSAQAASALQLSVDCAQPAGRIDLTPYSLGQGGLSHEPMFDAHLAEVTALRPKMIRLFVQEYFHLNPAPGQYHWETLDRSIENIRATGAEPLLSLCFKPGTLYPKVDPEIVHPTDYAAWEALIEALVRHCNQEKGYGIRYWEVGNEVDQSEAGGCPYLFKPEDYEVYYAHSAAAVRRADPEAKVGGPALAGHRSAIGDSLMALCGRGEAPLDFFSWHLYSNEPNDLLRSIRDVKGRLAKYPALAATETVIDEWNIQLIGNELHPGFQTAFILQTTLGFFSEGLTRSCYYHIRDHRVVPEDFDWMTPQGYKFMADWWNVEIQNSGLFDKEGRRRPSYYVFEMLRDMSGERLPVEGLAAGINAVAAQKDGQTDILLWNFPFPQAGAEQKIDLKLSNPPQGQFCLLRLNAPRNCLDTLSTGAAAELNDRPLSLSLPPWGVAWLRLVTE
ncbi:hypothetical protein LLH00_06810 [bacterium]|nr:hypothetical protein [bacterium]